MKKYFVLSGLFALVLFFSNCHTTKKVQATPLTYEMNVKPVIETNCSPCHIAGKGNKTPYDNYANASKDIDDMLRRIQLNPTDRGFMPFKHPKLSDSTIAVFRQWKNDGLKER
jgi:hypothetical protein